MYAVLSTDQINMLLAYSSTYEAAEQFYARQQRLTLLIIKNLSCSTDL